MSLFEDVIDFKNVPKTEGIKYIGSKLKLLPYILYLARRTDAESVLDGFSGSTRVSQAFARSGYRVLSNDRAVWSEILGQCYLLNQHPREHYFRLIRSLNETPPRDGWFTEHYGGEANNGNAIQSDGFKRPWQIHNTRKLDGIRQEIDDLDLSPLERAVALTSLILALDRVDSTLGHFSSYLRQWSPRSYKELYLEVPNVFVSDAGNEVMRGDVFDISREVDLAYFDPPYGSNNEKMPPSRVRYASYYHLWTTVCLNDAPELFGRARRRKDTSDTASGSVFEEFRRGYLSSKFLAVEAIAHLIRSVKARWIILSYSSGGRSTAEELHEILCRNGELVEVLKIDYKRNVMAEMKWTRQWLPSAQLPNQEFLFLLDKG